MESFDVNVVVGAHRSARQHFDSGKLLCQFIHTDLDIASANATDPEKVTDIASVVVGVTTQNHEITPEITHIAKPSESDQFFIESDLNQVRISDF